jgi:hypothetical protein
VQPQNNERYQATSQITRDLRKLLRAQTPNQKAELRKNILEMIERERRTVN